MDTRQTGEHCTPVSRQNLNVEQMHGMKRLLRKLMASRMPLLQRLKPQLTQSQHMQRQQKQHPQTRWKQERRQQRQPG